MMIVAEVQSDSLRRSIIYRTQFNALTLASFKGENVREYAEKAYSLLVPLDIDDKLPDDHLRRAPNTIRSS